MMLLEQMAALGHQQVIAFQNPACGLRGFLAIHNTRFGPALGGVRLWRYAGEEEALADALRLSRAMTYKAALAELPCGGGKAVIMDHAGVDRAAAFEAFGQIVDSLGGRFYTGRDVGITDADLAAIGRATHYVACESSPALGDLNELTAVGVWHGMRACLDFTGLRGKRVAIQGLGGVGMALARILQREGFEIWAADLDPARLREPGVHPLPPEEILLAPCDVLAPCALGGVITEETAGRIPARIVCGSANNILDSAEAGDALARRGIVYAPDYLVNAGALIRGAEFYLEKRADSSASIGRIYERTLRVLELARQRNISTARVADGMAEKRLVA